MKIYLGKIGLENSWQKPFPAEIKCPQCEKKAEIMFVGQEGQGNGKKPYICGLKETTGEKGGLWLHDVCSVAVYLCRTCFKPTALLNQA